MFKTFYKVFVVMLVIFAVAYMLQESSQTQESCAKIDGRWDQQRLQCLPATEKVIFQSLSKPYPLSLKSPVATNSALLTKVQQVDEFIYLSGPFTALDHSLSENSRDFAYLNFSQLLVLTTNQAQQAYFVAPFFIKGAGTGVFYYLGLFSFDYASQQAQHLYSQLLGERIKEIQIVERQDELRIDFKRHGELQSFAEYPTQASAVALQVVGLEQHQNQSAALTIVPRMHASWDRNNDGVNDCELDGSCDHSIDYTQPRME